MKDQGIGIQLVEIDRRQFLRFASGTLVALGTYGLWGCGGNSAVMGSNSVPLVKFSAQVVVPAGVTIPLKVGFNSTLISLSKGSFQGAVYGDSPTLVTVYDPATGLALYMGLVDPTSPTLTVNATSTAVALLYTALGGSQMTVDGTTVLMHEIASNQATATLASVIAGRVAATPFALGKADAQIITALQTAAAAIAPSVQVPPSKPSSITKPADAPAQLLIQPSTEFDGVTFVQSDNLIGYSVQNTKRRLGFVYTYLVGHVDAQGNKTSVSPPTQVGGILEVPATKGLLQSTLTSTGWSPVSSAVVPLGLSGSDSQTLYQMVYLTQVYNAPVPAFFSDPMWSGQIAAWNQTLVQLAEDTFINYFVNLFLQAAGLGGIVMTGAYCQQMIASLQTLPSIYVLLRRVSSAVNGSGVIDLEQLALDRAVLSTFLNSTIVSKQTLAKMSDIVKLLNYEKGVALEEVAGSVAALELFIVALGTLCTIGAIALCADLAAVAVDTATGDQGDLWSATVIVPQVKLSPTTATFVPGQSQPTVFTAAPPAGVTGPFVWTWTVTGGTAAQLSDGNGHQGTTLTKNPSATVTLLTTPLDKSNLKITVEGFVASSMESIGTASTTATAVNGPTAIQGSLAIYHYDAGSLGSGIEPENVEGYYVFQIPSPTLTGGKGSYSLTNPEIANFPESALANPPAAVLAGGAFGAAEAAAYQNDNNISVYNAGQNKLAYFAGAGEIWADDPNPYDGHFNTAADAVAYLQKTLNSAPVLYYYPG